MFFKNHFLIKVGLGMYMILQVRNFQINTKTEICMILLSNELY